LPTICPPEKVDILNKDCVIRIIIQYFMGIDRISIYTDLLLGILEFAILVIAFGKTENYSSFQGSYYYYLVIAPIYGLSYLFKIAFWPIANSDPTQDDQSLAADNQSTTRRCPHLLVFLRLLFLSLPLILPTVAELVIGIISIFIKFAVTKSASVNDLYVIHYSPVILSVIPLYLVIIRNQLPIKAIENIYEPYNFVGIAINTFVLLIGGWLGLNICEEVIFR
jgi:membrane protease YdiL (CAAX protease family)